MILLTACAPAKYKGWDGGTRYFEQQSERIEPSQNATINCRSPYKVKSGDTLSAIAMECNLDMDVIARQNHLSPPYHLDINQELIFNNEASSPASSSLASVQTPLAESFIWPLRQPYHFEFVQDGAGNHSLVIKAPIGEAVYAVAAGEVVYSGSGIENYGRLVIIKHTDGYLTIYAHNDSLVVSEGQQVKKGDLIATVGVTGDVKEPQLFFEARFHGRKVDAKPLFKEKFIK